MLVCAELLSRTHRLAARGTQAQPPLVTGKPYELKCLDTYNCNTQDPGTTNWADPPWARPKPANKAVGGYSGRQRFE